MDTAVVRDQAVGSVHCVRLVLASKSRYGLDIKRGAEGTLP